MKVKSEPTLSVQSFKAKTSPHNTGEEGGRLPYFYFLMSFNKYGVARKQDRTCDGITFASKHEMTTYQHFKLLQRAGEIKILELQPRFILIPKPNKIEYVADFRIIWADGREEIVDAKGMETPVFKLKLKLFRHFYPNLTLRLV